MALLTKADLFSGREDLQFAEVECPEWGGTVRVRGLTATERDRYEASLVKLDKKGRVERLATDAARGRLAALGICDEKGRRVFSDDDAAQLGDKNGRALDRVCDKIRELSGMGEDALESERGN